MGLFKKQIEEEPESAIGKYVYKYRKAPYNMKIEHDEVEMDNFQDTDYPESLKKFRFILEQHDESLEGIYYWMHTNYKVDWGYNEFDKVIDVFAASEQSAFFGVTQQRLGLQQDKVSQFLQAIGKMTKEIFQFVRELRIIDERLELYSDSYYEGQNKAESADITLKGIWIDLVEGGAKNPASVYGLAREVGFTVLPDLFFTIRPKVSTFLNKPYKELTRMEAKKFADSEIKNIDSTVDTNAKDFNRKVREVLKRKLRTYLQWKRETFAELLTRRRFTLQYFRQHYDIIRMYMNWVKPYLRNIRRLGLSEKHMNSVELVSAFEGSLIEVEFIAKKKYKNWYAVGLVNILFRTRPAMSFQQEGFQRGPKHSGKATINLRAYCWTKDMIEDYIAMRQEEDLDLISTIDDSLKEAIKAMGDELKDYLNEAGEIIFKREAELAKKKKEKEKKKRMPSAADPFISVFAGFGEIFDALTGGFDVFKKGDSKNVGGPPSEAIGDAKNACWRSFKNYRKAHKILTF